jgi:hypothetical protein
MSSETWGYASEEERKEFVRTWRAWRERAWCACNRADGLSPNERRVLFETIKSARIADCAEAEQWLIARVRAADIAVLLGIGYSTVGRIRRQLRDKQILVDSRTTGGRKMAASDVISLSWIEAVETEVETARKHPHSSEGVSAKHPQNYEGVSHGTKTPSILNETPSFSSENPLTAVRVPLTTSSIEDTSPEGVPAARSEFSLLAATHAAIVWPRQFRSMTSRRFAAARYERLMAKIAPLGWQPSPTEAAVIAQLVLRECPIKHIERALGDEIALKPGDPLDLQQLVHRAARYQAEADAKRQSNLRQHLRVVK